MTQIILKKEKLKKETTCEEKERKTQIIANGNSLTSALRHDTILSYEKNIQKIEKEK